MSIQNINPDDGALDALIAEHVNTLCHRARVSGRQLAMATGINPGTMARKMRGAVWHVNELVSVCAFFDVTLEEMTTGLPPLAEWQARRDLRGCRDSNPRPSDP